MQVEAHVDGNREFLQGRKCRRKNREIQGQVRGREAEKTGWRREENQREEIPRAQRGSIVSH